MKKFNYQEIIKDYILKRRLAKREQDPTKRLEYENDANWDRYVLDSVTPHIRRPIEHDEVLDGDTAFMHAFGDYAPYVRDLASSEYIEKEETPEKKIYANIGKLLMLTRRFYESIKKEYYTNVYNVMADSESLLRAKKSKRGKFAGEVIPLANRKSFLINVTLNGSIQDYLTFVHEFSHMNSIIINDEHDLYSKTCLYEIDALFMEMLAIDGLSDTFGSEANDYSIDIFNDYVYSSRIAAAKMDLLATFSSSEIRNKPNIVNHLEKEGYTLEELKDILYMDIEEFFKYSFAYLVAIELFYKYKENKEEAINLLDTIIKMKDKNAREYLEELNKLGIVIGQHVNEYKGMLVERYEHGKRL